MGKRTDAIELLKAANPVVEAELPDHDSPAGRQLLTRIITQPRKPQASPPGKRRQVIVVALLALTLIAATWIILRPVTDPLGLSCYQTPDLEGNRVALPAGTDLDPQACTPLWENQTLTDPDIVPLGSVPPFQGCVTPTGGLAVFPTDDPAICNQLGLDPPDPASLPAAEAIRRLNDQLATHFSTQTCQPIDQAAQDVRRILDQAGFADWTITTSPASPDRPCASYALDNDNQTIHLIPIPQPQP